MQPLVLRWWNSREHKTWDRRLMQDVALEDQRKRIKRALTWAKRSNFFRPQCTYLPQFLPPSLPPSFLSVSIRGDGFLRWNVFFSPPLRRSSGTRANLRLAIRRTTARPQKALIFQRKRASASRGKKETRREKEKVKGAVEREENEASERLAKRRPAEVNRQQGG